MKGVKPGVKKPVDPEAGQTFSDFWLVEWSERVLFIPGMSSSYLNPSVADRRVSVINEIGRVITMGNGFGAMNL